MTKKLQTKLILALFLCVQLLSFLHVAEFGINEHQHHGQVCKIFLGSDNAQILTSSSSDITFDSFEFLSEISSESFQIFFHNNCFSARAPPFIS